MIAPLRFILAIMAKSIMLFFLAPDHSVASNLKTMECERYMINKNNSKENWSIFVITFFADTQAMSTKIERDGKLFVFSDSEDWKILWKSSDNLRAVATLVREPAPQSVDSPVLLVDVDFKNVRFKEIGMGGTIDLDPVVYDPWKYECRRLD